MGGVFQRVQDAIAAERWVAGHHADEMLRTRCITERQIVSGFSQGRLIAERPGARPNPVVEMEQSLADGTPVKAGWAFLPVSRVAKLVTVHFFDR
jgi:hypothetical protein